MSPNEEVVLMGPVLDWPKEQGESPVCNGSCSKGSWTLNPKTGYWVCPKCLKPGQQYLRVCEICEEIYMIEPWPTITVIDPKIPRVLNHQACLNYLERIESGIDYDHSED